MELNSDNVKTVFMDSLFTDEEAKNITEDSEFLVVAEGVTTKVGFNPDRLLSHKEDVKTMLYELPEAFFKDSGGGWSFLNAITTKDGTQWAEHKNVDQLLTLGLGLNLVSYLMPREMWKILPGAMPYFVVDLEIEHDSN